MPRFKVVVKKTMALYATVEVDAPTGMAARRKVKLAAEDGDIVDYCDATDGAISIAKITPIKEK